MNNPYNSGTPDVWYSGGLDLWVEYKFLPTVPQTANVFIANPEVKQPMLSRLQQNWLNDRYVEGRNVAVIIGCAALGGVILRDQEWMKQFTASEFRDLLVPRKAVAQWITEATSR